MSNILMIIPALYCGGGLQKISLNLSEQLINRGNSVIVVDTYAPPIEKMGYLKILPQFCKLDSYKVTRKNLDFFSNIIKDNNVDLIIYQGFYPSVNAFLSEWHKSNTTPIISIYHSSPEAANKKNKNEIKGTDLSACLKRIFFGIYKEYQKILLRNYFGKPARFSRKVILLSESYRSSYQRLSGGYNNIEVISNFIPVDSVENVKKKKQLLYVGRLEEDVKKVSRAIRIWEKIESKVPDWEFIIAGEGSCKKQYIDYVSEKQIPRITFKGYVAKPTSLYAESSILLFTSDYEGFGLVLVEAMQQGCIPILYNSYPAAGEIIEHNLEGLLIPPFEEDIYIESLLCLIQDKHKFNDMSRYAIMKGQKYTPERIMPLWDNLIKDVLAQ